MKRISLFLLLGLLTFPNPCSSDYLVRLTTGGSFTVTAYWEDTDQIIFYTSGGSVGIPKKVIQQIQLFNPAVEYAEESIAITIPSPKPLAAETTVSKQCTQAKGLLLEEMEENKFQLEADLQKALEQFRQASKNKNHEGKKEAMDDMVTTSGKLVELTNKLQEFKFNNLLE